MNLEFQMIAVADEIAKGMVFGLPTFIAPP
jgi:hypothetical protein